jgi:hypothetical protein
MPAQRQVTILVRTDRIARRAAVCSIAVPARPADIPPPASAGFKPELS